jgi:hypothetical protein
MLREDDWHSLVNRSSTLFYKIIIISTAYRELGQTKIYPSNFFSFDNIAASIFLFRLCSRNANF